MIIAAALPMVGCGSKDKDEEYNPSNIAVKQPGNGPPPMNAPMGSSQDKAKIKP